MADKEQENKKTAITEQVLATSASPVVQPEIVTLPPAESADKKKQRTTGNKIFDWGVYASIAWAGVSAVSLFTAHEAIHGTNKYFGWLRSLHSGMTKGFEKVYSNTFLKNAPAEKLKDWSEGSALYWILGTGGTALTWPIKYLEDNRMKLAGKIDKTLGTTPPDPDAIAKEPKQSWKSVLSGRFMSVALGFTAFVAMGPKVADKASKWFGEKAANVYFRFKPIAENADAAYKEARVKTVRKWSDLGAFDVFFTVITASIMYAFSRSVAKRTGKNVDEMMTLDPSTPTPLDPIFHSSVSKLQGSEADRPKEKKFTDGISRREAAAAKPELYSQQVAAEAEQASLSPRTV